MRVTKLQQLAQRFDRGGAESILETYLKLHEGKIGAHWMWVAIQRIVAGEPETEVLDDYGHLGIPATGKGKR